MKKLLIQAGNRRQTTFLAVIAVMILVVTWWASRQVGFVLLRQDGLNELFRYRNSIQYMLERYRPLPAILAVNPLLEDAFEDEKLLPRVNLYLEQMVEKSGASVIYMMDREGNTIASSNWSSPRTFLGKNFGYRPYFLQAMQGGEGFYSALGVISGARGVYYARRVEVNGRPVGVIVVKRDMEEIEKDWESPWDRGEAAFTITDSTGIIFISTRRDWLFHSLEPVSRDDLGRIQQQRRYDNQTLQPLYYMQQPKPYSLQNSNSDLRSVGIGKERTESFLTQSVAMPETDWRLHLFIKTTAVNRIAAISTLSMAGVLVVLLMGGLYWRERQWRYQEVKAALDHLDDKVRARTLALTEANRKLQWEVERHKQTEKNLRDTRNELVQAAKMAVLGQMSAGINHELNQPLTAIRCYLENAEEFLRRDRQAQVAENLREISRLTEHMSGIIRQLKAFARKAEDEHEPLNMLDALRDSLKIVHPMLRENSVQLNFDNVSKEPLIINGDLVRLKQVFVNLLSNAVQAVEQKDERKIKVGLYRRDKQVVVEVCDNGHGLPGSAIQQIFEPFYTTRSIDQGLGLGLSISRHIVEAMEGVIKADNVAEGGARFTVEIPLIKSDTASAVAVEDRIHYG
ncbi:sensor histidine kinase [Spongorhabdus nitratireducens]